ncbi:uncharacterized protein C8A04DRAFT_15641 [Dichotomopilus funicola]|uniref:NAD(P)-binding domain-containing protein n=1 Tax=Dichotomopilus funicola TaxID=1934379 RepID=A0AAN6UVI3_9PEZI|nr:hypothetical protein C8A04DRAFT_15641 [Dichotomopilus funicola]
MSSASLKHVLLLGGHGKIAQLLTPLLLRRGWDVTSVIRTDDQSSTVREVLERVQPEDEGVVGKLQVLVHSLAEVKTQEDAREVIERAGKERDVDYVVWSAGAGGKGGAQNTNAIDKIAASNFVLAAAEAPKITRFLHVSHLGSRYTKPAWWSDYDWKGTDNINHEVFPVYYAAKLAVDELLYSVSKTSGPSFVGISLRPGSLSDEPAGKVELGRTASSKGKISREAVARVADVLLASEGVKNTWLDLLDGEEEVESAVKKAVDEGVNAVEGEKCA